MRWHFEVGPILSRARARASTCCMRPLGSCARFKLSSAVGRPCSRWQLDSSSLVLSSTQLSRPRNNSYLRRPLARRLNFGCINVGIGLHVMKEQRPLVRPPPPLNAIGSQRMHLAILSIKLAAPERSSEAIFGSFVAAVAAAAIASDARTQWPALGNVRALADQVDVRASFRARAREHNTCSKGAAAAAAAVAAATSGRSLRPIG